MATNVDLFNDGTPYLVPYCISRIFICSFLKFTAGELVLKRLICQTQLVAKMYVLVCLVPNFFSYFFPIYFSFPFLFIPFLQFLDYSQRGYGNNRNMYYPHHDGAKTTLVIFHFKFSSCTFVVSILGWECLKTAAIL